MRRHIVPAAEHQGCNTTVCEINAFLQNFAERLSTTYDSRGATGIGRSTQMVRNVVAKALGRCDAALQCEQV